MVRDDGDRQGSGSERRRETRVSARIEVRFKDPQDAARAMRVYSLNFSAGGLCIRPQKRYQVGEKLRLAMTVEGDEYELNGVVAWERNGVIGVRFEGLTDDVRARLESLVETFTQPR